MDPYQTVLTPLQGHVVIRRAPQVRWHQAAMGYIPTGVLGARGVWAPNATSHRGYCLGPTLPETRVGRYLAVSRSLGAYSAPGLLFGGWITPPGGEILLAHA
jgi:hypothetical protein